MSSEKKRYLALDAGGTKVAGILYDEDFNLIRSAVTGSLRGNTTSEDLIQKHIDAIVKDLGLEAGGRIEFIGGTCEGSLINRIKELCDVGDVRITGEFDLGMSAAGLFGDGMLALSGTGATVFCKYNGKYNGTGGYGASVADEGSGYWIARNAFVAAIHDDEGRGPYTVLTDMIPQHLGFKDRSELKQAIFSIYSHTHHSPVACVAQCTPLVTYAAQQGDEIASEILIDAGEVIADQILFLIRRYELPDGLPLTISGSVWRGDKLIFDSFASKLHDQSPSRPIVIPKLEPIMGVIARHYMNVNCHFDSSDAEFLAGRFPDFTFELNKMKIRK